MKTLSADKLFLAMFCVFARTLYAHSFKKISLEVESISFLEEKRHERNLFTGIISISYHASILSSGQCTLSLNSSYNII